MSLLVACPVILPPRADVLASWTHRPHRLIINGARDEWKATADTIRVDYWAPWENVGVAASWNDAMRAAIRHGHDHVALVSQGTVLDGGTARLADLVDEHADWRGLLTDFAWHVIVLSVELWAKIGPFDERFFPAYYEDCDYCRRLDLAGLHTAANPIPKIGRDLLDGTETQAGALIAGAIDPSYYGINGERYRQAWGGDPGYETYTVKDDPSSAEQ